MAAIKICFGVAVSVPQINRRIKMKKFLLILLDFCITYAAFGEGFQLPLYNPDLMTFFTSESRYFLSTAMEYPENIFQFSSGGWFSDNEGNLILETAQELLFPIRKRCRRRHRNSCSS